MKPLTKAQSERIHTKRRAAQRFGLLLSREDLNGLVAQIHCRMPCATFLERQSLSRSLWEVDLRGNRAVAVYDKKRKTIVTVWPADGSSTKKHFPTPAPPFVRKASRRATP